MGRALLLAAAAAAALAPHKTLLSTLLTAPTQAALVQTLGNNIDTLFDPNFANFLQQQIDQQDDQNHRQKLQDLMDLTVEFAEQVAENTHKLQHELHTEQSAANAIVDAATAGNTKAEPMHATRPQLSPARGEQAQHIERARNRFKLEKLLDAAHTSASELERVLADMSDQLDAQFFLHLEWEVGQQIDAKNRRLLEILELVVQRACAVVETQCEEARILSSLLYFDSSDERQHVYEKQLKSVDPTTRKRFAEAVYSTQLALEKAVLSGQAADLTLLRKLRCVAVEMLPYVEQIEEE